MGQVITLAAKLREGPLELSYALRCATDVANALHELHKQGRMHGSVASESIALSDNGAELLPPQGRARYAGPAGDVAAFGAVLYEMIVGAKPAPGDVESLPAPGTGDGEEAIQAAAVRLAWKCIGTVSNSPEEIEKALTEVRLLDVQAATLRPAEALPEAAPPPEPTPGRPAAYTPVAVEGFFATAKDEPVEPTLDGAKCPKCGEPSVYPSRPRSWVEGLFDALNFPPLRCRRCQYRFLKLLGRFNFESGTPKPKGG